MGLSSQAGLSGRPAKLGDLGVDPSWPPRVMIACPGPTGCIELACPWGDLLRRHPAQRWYGWGWPVWDG
jgi:hypothetical protein